MAVDQNIVIKLHKSSATNVEITKQLKINCLTVWKIVKKFKETSNTLDREGQSRKKIHIPQLIKNTREKL